MKSPFDKWFEEQFGKCPMSTTQALNIESKLTGMEMDVAKLKRDLRILREWHSNQRAALYGWNAKGG